MALRIDTRKLERIRERMGVSRYRFAILLGINAQSYLNILNTKSASLKRIAAIARILKLNPKDLLIIY